MVHTAGTLWLMGPTSAGKTTIAHALAKRIQDAGEIPVTTWDGDQVRQMLGPDLGFSSHDRLRVVRTLAAFAKVSSDAGVFTIVAALTAHEDARRLVRTVLPNHYVGYVHCSIETCIARDPKGLYRKAMNGEIDTLVGFNSPYVAPRRPDIEIDTSQTKLSDEVDTLVAFLRERNFGYLSRDNERTHDRAEQPRS